MVTASDLLGAFRARGHELWLVGGTLRDHLLSGGSPSDLAFAAGTGHDDDYATDAVPDEVEAIARELGAPVVTVGRRFGTIGILVDGHWSEITTFRGDSYTAGSRWPDVRFGASIGEDLARRDFTVNALAWNPATGEGLDPYDGAADLRARLIRAVGDPETRFREDPLRILRGLRFVSQLGFALDDATRAGMVATVPLLATLSQERVTSELDRLLAGAQPAAGLASLRIIGALPVILPELSGMPGCEQNRFHRFDVWGHTLATVEAIDIQAEGANTRLRRWAAFLHDAGKPPVRHLKPNGEWGFYRHETVGAEIVAALADRLRLGRKESQSLTLLVRRHMDRPDPADRRLVRRFMTRAEGHWRDLLALKVADNASHTYDDSSYHAELTAACEAVERDEAAVLRGESPLTGIDLLTMFGRPPGPWVGAIKEQLSRLVRDGDLNPGDRAGAEAVARRIASRL